MVSNAVRNDFSELNGNVCRSGTRFETSFEIGVLTNSGVILVYFSVIRSHYGHPRTAQGLPFTEFAKKVYNVSKSVQMCHYERYYELTQPPCRVMRGFTAELTLNTAKYG